MCVCFSFQRSKLSKFEDFNSQPKFADLDINKKINTNIYSDNFQWKQRFGFTRQRQTLLKKFIWN